VSAAALWLLLSNKRSRFSRWQTARSDDVHVTAESVTADTAPASCWSAGSKEAWLRHS
jgi:hypothetical protein